MGIILATVHPAKFPECIEPAIDQKIPIPQQLNNCMDKDMVKTSLSSHEKDLKEFLLNA